LHSMFLTFVTNTFLQPISTQQQVQWSRCFSEWSFWNLGVVANICLRFQKAVFQHPLGRS
jgi:hypothetical protein